MKTTLKKILRFFAALVLIPFITLIAALLTINLVDWDRHRGFVASMIERFSDYRVEHIEGITIGLLSSAEVGVDRIKIQHKTGYGALNKLETRQTYLKIKVFPLFQNRLIVQGFILDGARINLQPSKVDPNAPQKDASEEKPFDLADLPAIFINVANINDSNLSYAGSGEPFVLQLENAGVTATGNDKPSMLSAEGKVGDLPFELLGAMGSFDAFRDSKAAYPARVKAKIADHSVEVRGSMNFRDDVSHFDVDASGPGLTKLKQALKLNIGDIPAYTLSFAVDKKPKIIRFEKVDLVLGNTKVLGNGGLDFSGDRMLVQADLKSEDLYAEDFKGLFQSSKDKKLRDPNEPPRPAGQYFSDKPIETDFMKKMDADIQITVNKFHGEKAGTAIDAILGRVRLNAGRLVMDPLNFSVAEGTIGGDLVFDAREKDIKAKITLGARKINLSSLLGRGAKEVPVLNLKPDDIARGILTGHLDISMHGRTPMQLAQTVKGPVQLAVEDGKLSATLVEVAGLDISETIGDWILKHPLKELRCGLFSLEANEGVYRTKSFVIATSDSNLLGKGQLNLPGNKVDFTLNVVPKDFSIGSLRTPIKVEGELNKIGVSLEPTPLVAKALAALALGAVNPALALLPLVEPGLGKEGGCSKYKAELRQVVANAEKDVSREDMKATKSVVR